MHCFEKILSKRVLPFPTEKNKIINLIEHPNEARLSLLSVLWFYYGGRLVTVEVDVSRKKILPGGNIVTGKIYRGVGLSRSPFLTLHLPSLAAFYDRGTEDEWTENGTEWKTEWNGKQNESFEGKQNIWISLIQLLTKENDLK